MIGGGSASARVGKELVSGADDQINQIIKRRQEALGAQIDGAKMQLLAPNTLAQYSPILQNSYLSDLDLSDISKKLDIEMAVMLDPAGVLQKISATNNGIDNTSAAVIAPPMEAKAVADAEEAALHGVGIP